MVLKHEADIHCNKIDFYPMQMMPCIMPYFLTLVIQGLRSLVRFWGLLEDGNFVFSDYFLMYSFFPFLKLKKNWNPSMLETTGLMKSCEQTQAWVSLSNRAIHGTSRISWKNDLMWPFSNLGSIFMSSYPNDGFLNPI